MRLETIKNYVEKTLNISIVNEGGKGNKEIWDARQLYYELASLHCKDPSGKKVSNKSIAKFINHKYEHSLNVKRESFQYFITLDNKYKKAFDNFGNLREEDTSRDTKLKYELLLNRFKKVQNKYTALTAKNKKRKVRFELETLIDSIDADKEDLLIERLKVIIPMLNKAKFN